jgi:hypothetical protein
MDTLFKKTNAYWVKYSEYEYRCDDGGNFYIMPESTAKPSVYDPIKDPEPLVVDALNIGRLAMKQDIGKKELMDDVMNFVTNYGLLGFMTALPITSEFLSYDAVYLPKNHFIKEESMTTQDYLSLFFPFDKPDVSKGEITAQWNVNVHSDDRVMAALAMTFVDEPIAVGLGFQRIYAERFDWLVTQFQDWAFKLVSAFLFYEDKNVIDDFSRGLYRQGMSAFGGKAPTYHISLYDDKPKIVWDFHSLLLTIQTMFGFALTDESRPLRLCRHCNLAFIAKHTNAGFCSPECKNQHNVYKGRNKKD